MEKFTGVQNNAANYNREPIANEQTHKEKMHRLLKVIEGGRSNDDPGQSTAELSVVKDESIVDAAFLQSLYDSFWPLVVESLETFPHEIDYARVNSFKSDYEQHVNSYEELSRLILECYEDDFEDPERSLAVQQVVEHSLGIDVQNEVKKENG